MTHIEGTLKAEMRGSTAVYLLARVRKVGRLGKTKPCWEVRWITPDIAAYGGLVIKSVREIATLAEAEIQYSGLLRILE